MTLGIETQGHFYLTVFSLLRIGCSAVAMATPKIPWIMFGMMPAKEAMMPAEIVVLLTTDSINISKIKYPNTITTSPAMPLIIKCGIAVLVFNSFVSSL